MASGFREGILILIGRNKNVIPVRSSRDHIGMQVVGLLCKPLLLLFLYILLQILAIFCIFSLHLRTPYQPEEFGLGDCTTNFWNFFNFDLSYDDYDPITTTRLHHT